MRSHSYLNSAKRIINDYDGTVPFATWLKEYFRNNKKFGGKDRKEISNLCFGYYRTYHLLQELQIEEHLIKGLYLTSFTSSVVLEELNKDLQTTIGFSVVEKVRLLDLENKMKLIFPFQSQLSEQIDQEEFNRSFLIQPDLFLRIRPGKQQEVITKLVANDIQFSLVHEDCLQLTNNTKIDNVLNIDKDVVIQDLNSQSTIGILAEYIQSDEKLSMWDCCAASGGKSILFHDRYSKSSITVSDVRERILFNLDNRFQRAGIKNYKKLLVDLTSRYHNPNQYDVVVCDAPCSGSGTWSRTPEQLKFFPIEKIDHYAQLQQKIAIQVSTNVKKEGYLLYITCSVFKKENEEVVEFIQSKTELTLLHQQYYKGYLSKADTLFAALFKA
jgi:tRNA and rRNA cytosine-C5-methylases